MQVCMWKVKEVKWIMIDCQEWYRANGDLTNMDG